MKRPSRVLVLILCAPLVLSSGCATIFVGGKSEAQRSANINWGFFVLDIFLTGAIGLIVDFATGAIYLDKPASDKACVPVDACQRARRMVAGAPEASREERLEHLRRHFVDCVDCHDALTLAEHIAEERAAPVESPEAITLAWRG
ncbi:MAG: hypothetical protein M9894_20465 [Planctomycetes bacterium]|nr:hypothetical protein [Planctomycetota bacterium]